MIEKKDMFAKAEQLKGAVPGEWQSKDAIRIACIRMMKELEWLKEFRENMATKKKVTARRLKRKAVN